MRIVLVVAVVAIVVVMMLEQGTRHEREERKRHITCACVRVHVCAWGGLRSDRREEEELGMCNYYIPRTWRNQGKHNDYNTLPINLHPSASYRSSRRKSLRPGPPPTE